MKTRNKSWYKEKGLQWKYEDQNLIRVQAKGSSSEKSQTLKGNPIGKSFTNRMNTKTG